MRVLFRADASLSLGYGHVMRCLTLAKALRELGADCHFASRALRGGLGARIAEDFPLHELPATYAGEQTSGLAEAPIPEKEDLDHLGTVLEGQRFDWVVLDHYGLGMQWERAARAFAPRLLAIDDLPQRRHCVNALLDQNLLADEAEAYPPSRGEELAVRLFGPGYALLRPEFARFRRKPRPAVDGKPRLLLFFGGGEGSRALPGVVRELLSLPVSIDVVVGGASAALAELRALAAVEPALRLHVDTQEMAALMWHADLYLGAGGSVTWERACLGLPGVVAAFSENQVSIGLAGERAGIQRYLGMADALPGSAWRDAAADLLADTGVLHGMRTRAAALCDGAGAERVARMMFEAGGADAH
ncbi:UDP-2,4-diacetamido-2,4,6-trideoxy-beta-L-altropyranose hydrolase [Pseudomonas sp. PDM13]|uniref:UDP-2,4-diacetamido-2,4, 6-trideoxy-beta-L-altropyranose hydrolase n=1 Tax=Pseudomonas sp. PDM13 TaxID=2769255 RepID=UPI0021E0C8D1|nr:UDP-2,4-diacetamido-2,4,6-trideoxy-beta-L-altropyranose hydrolase [Pseudomonas sp. PDM13]MCU9948567.1 UDP-2,4-diacetamido-2,4,6-trideoxy-beta-L-altropyranose hydrolase [Pseudomonas sp. PDM13]